MKSNAIEDIKKHGYCHLKSVFPAARILEAKVRVESLHKEDIVIDDQKTPFLNRGHQVLYNVQNRDYNLLDLLIGNIQIQEILVKCLNDTWYQAIPKGKPNYILRGYSARASGPEQMPLHIDSFIPNHGPEISVMQVAVPLDSQNTENGCTIAVPGSHQSNRYATQADLKDAIPIESEPGDVIIWDSRLWHGALGNISNSSRWALIGTFSRWWIKQNYEITRTLRQEIYEQLSDEQKVVMGYASMPPRNEHDRVDMKGGYEMLKLRVADYFSEDR